MQTQHGRAKEGRARQGRADTGQQGSNRAESGRAPSSMASRGRQITLSHVFEGHSVRDALLQTHMFRSRCAVINGRAGLFRVKELEHQHCQGGQHKPETP